MNDALPMIGRNAQLQEVVGRATQDRDMDVTYQNNAGSNCRVPKPRTQFLGYVQDERYPRNAGRNF